MFVVAFIAVTAIAPHRPQKQAHQPPFVMMVAPALPKFKKGVLEKEVEQKGKLQIPIRICCEGWRHVHHVLLMKVDSGLLLPLFTPLTAKLCYDDSKSAKITGFGCA